MKVRVLETLRIGNAHSGALVGVRSIAFGMHKAAWGIACRRQYSDM